MHFIFYPYMIGVFLYMMIIVNNVYYINFILYLLLLIFFMRQRIASDTTHADFVWNDQIDDYIDCFYGMYYNIYTDYANRTVQQL